jgi:hypothetical protein
MSQRDKDMPRDWMLVKFDDMKHIEGMILTIVDSLGFSDSQERAVKSLVRQAIWDEVHKPYRVWIADSMVEEAHKEWAQYSGHGFGNGKAIPINKQSK